MLSCESHVPSPNVQYIKLIGLPEEDLQYKTVALIECQNRKEMTRFKKPVSHDLALIVWQRFCEPSPDLGFLSIPVRVCVCDKMARYPIVLDIV